VAFSMAWMAAGGGESAAEGGPGGPRGLLAGFRAELYRCLTRRADALFGVADAVLCAGGRVTDLARLSLVPESGRGHGALYDGVNAGRVDVARLRRAVAGLPLPRWPDGRIRLAVDVSNWLRPDAVTSGERLFCHVKGRGKNAGQMIAGWPYSFAAALSPGASSWTVLLDAVRLGPADDQTAVTAAQIREVTGRLVAAGHWKDGDPYMIIALDAGYNSARLAWLLADLPVVLVVRVRADRVFYRRVPSPPPGAPGRPGRHGPPVRCGDQATWRGAAVTGRADTARYGPGRVLAWHRVHQKLTGQGGGWEDWPRGRELPLVEGTLIHLAATRRAAGYPALEPMWLWASVPDAGEADVRTLWQAYHRRFDLEHAFRFLKQQLGWTRPLLRDPAAADRWTWLIIAACGQLYLARPLAAAIRLPWQRPQLPGTMTPARVRAGFRHVRETVGSPARSAKPATPGPGRPQGSLNSRKAPRHPVGKPNRKRPPDRQAPGKSTKTNKTPKNTRELRG
jgi:DDE superfamily endonuclease